MNKTVWVRALNSNGATVASVEILQPTRKTYSGTGATTVGGIAPHSRTRSRTSTGGVTASGVAPHSRTRAYRGTGGALLRGAATTAGRGTRSYVGTGGLTTGGAATKARTKVPARTGGALLRGAAPTSFTLTLNKKVWLRATSANGATVVSLGIYQPPIGINGGVYVGSGGASLGGFAQKSKVKTPTRSGGAVLGGAAPTFKSSVANKRVWLRAINSGGSVVSSVGVFQPAGGFYVGGGGTSLRGAATTRYVNPYQVTLTTVNSNSSHRLQTYAVDLAIGDIIEWGSVVGGTRADVEVYNDGTWSSLATVTSFQFRVYSAGAWGAWATRDIESSAGTIRTFVPTGGIQTSGAAPHNRRRSTAGVGGASFSGVALHTRGKAFRAAGGVSAAGLASVATTKDFTPEGGISTGGAANIGSGTLVFTIYTHTPSGGVLLSGDFIRSRTKIYSPTGGVKFTGEASGGSPTKRTWVFTPMGGAEFEGRAVTQITRYQYTPPTASRTVTVARENRNSAVPYENRTTATSMAA